MKIVDIKTKIIPSNPRSKNYPIGYPGGIASNSNGVTPDLSIYLLKEIWERNFEERTDEYGNEYLYIRKPLAIGGGATMYASNGVVVPSIFDGLPLDNQTIWKNPTTGKIEVIGGSGSSFDENAMWSALSGSSDNQINKSHLTTALDGYATQNWVIENYATKSELSAVSNKLNDFLEGSDTDNIINKWKELEAFLSGMAETDNLAEILETKADRSYVDSTFVTLATKQTITGEKTFSSVLNTAAIKASGAITAPSLAVSDYVTVAGIKLRKLEDGALMLEGNLALTGALTMYASNGQSFDTIYDGLPIDNDTIYWQEVEGSRVLKAREGSGSSFDKSAMWTALAGSTTEQVNKTHLTTALTGYATESWVTSKNYLTSVSIATISDLHANWDALLKAAPSSYVTRWPTISEVTDRKNLIIKLNGGSTEGTNLFTYNVTGEKTINITPAGIGAAASSHNHSWSNITSGKPTTLAGYGITDAYTKTESDSKYPTKTGSGASGTWGINVTGNAGSATKLQTARSLWGNNFDGTANINGDITLAIGKGIYLSANDERWLLQTKRSDNTQINGIKTNGFQMCTYFGDTKTMQFSSDRIYSYVDFRAEKDLYINGIRLHKTADGVITLEGNLAVTGGITTYAIDPVSVSTVMDGVVVDGTTIKKENGKLVAVGGGEAGNVAWDNISGKPSVFPTNIANITDLHSSWDAVLAAQKPAWLTAVSIATISDLHANWDALLKAAPSAYVTRWPTISEVTGKQNLIVKLNGGTTEGTNQFTYNATGAKTINITPAGIGAAASSHSHNAISASLTGTNALNMVYAQMADNDYFRLRVGGTASNAGYVEFATADDGNEPIYFRQYTGTFTTVKRTLTLLDGSGYSSFPVTVTAPTFNGNLAWSHITSKPTTLAGYGITDAPTKTGSGASGTWSIGITGNAGSASKLQTTHTLWGQNFNGTQNVSGNMSNVGKISANGEIITSSANSFRAVYGSYGFFIRNDGVSTYFMHTNKDDPYGGWNNRPITIDNASGRISINSALDVGSVTTFYNKVTGTSISCSDWHRSTGQTGWVNDSYGGGIYMTDATWVRVWNGKGFLCENTIESSYRLSARQLVNVYGALGYGWGSGQAAFQVAIPTNENQTPILLAYNGVNGNQTGNDRYFAIEVLNTGLRNVHFNVSGKETVRMRANYFEVNGDILATGGTTFYGSDIRYKSIIHPVMLLALNKIAEAPSFVYRWNRPNMNQNRLNLGGSAQYAQKILPWAVNENDNFLSMDYATVAYTFAVHTARHLLTYETRTDKKIKKLENRVKYLEKQLKKLGYEEASIVDDQSV